MGSCANSRPRRRPDWVRTETAPAIERSALPQDQVHPRVQNGRRGVAHHGIEVVPQFPALGVLFAEHGVALDVGEASLLPEHRPLVFLVGDADLRYQSERGVGDRLPRREGLGAFRRVQAGEHAGIGARRRLLEGHHPRFPHFVAGRRDLVGAEDPGPVVGGFRRHAEHLLAHGQLVVVDPRLSLPGLQQPRDLTVDTDAIQTLMADTRHVQDALAQHPELFQLLCHARKHRLGQSVQIPEQALLPSEKGKSPLLPPRVRDRRRQPGRHERRGLPETPAFRAVGVRQAFLE